jgi:hypothetical protein
MKHPVEGDLALLASRDLDFFSQWRVGRHVAGCEQCRAVVESFEALRSKTAVLGELPPEIAWNRLASEMKANIRLGLSAGECVANGRFRPAPKQRGFFGFNAAGYQTALAYAGVVLLVVAGLWLERPQPPAALSAVPGSGSELAATRDGVELSEAGGGSFGLRYGTPRDAREISYSADAKGGMGARYVDTRTGYVTVVSVNVE